jgi:hypothetical protein
MIPHPPRQRMEISSLRSTIITITTIITANIAGMRPASSWFLPDIAAITTIITIIITTANIAIDVTRRQTVEKQGLRALFPCVN